MLDWSTRASSVLTVTLTALHLICLISFVDQELSIIIFVDVGRSLVDLPRPLLGATSFGVLDSSIRCLTSSCVRVALPQALSKGFQKTLPFLVGAFPVKFVFDFF